MKIKIKRQIMILFLLGIIAVFDSCTKPEIEQPPIILPKFEIPTGAKLISIAQLKARHIASSSVLDSIKGDTIVQGIIISNDSTGNMYKYIMIQDTSGGLQIGIDNNSLYTEYKLGQRVYVKCKNLVLGSYGKMTQLGINNAGQVGRILEVDRKTYIYKDSLPGKPLQPREITAFNQLKEKYLCTLVKLTNVSFSTPGQPYSSLTATTNRDIKDSVNSVVVLRTSNYATFATSLLPAGKGNIVGIYTTFTSSSTANQLAIRDLSDVFVK